MALRWANSDEQVHGIRAERRPFFEDVLRRVTSEDPGAVGAMVEEICGEFQKLMIGAIDEVSVPQYASGSWVGTPRQVVYDVTEDLDASRWWLGLLVMDTAVRYHYALVASRSHGDRALRYRPDIRHLHS